LPFWIFIASPDKSHTREGVAERRTPAGKDFISLGPAVEKDGVSRARPEIDSGDLKFSKIVTSMAAGE
jgi:hypothetical protein